MYVSFVQQEGGADCVKIEGGKERAETSTDDDAVDGARKLQR